MEKHFSQVTFLSHRVRVTVKSLFQVRESLQGGWLRGSAVVVCKRMTIFQRGVGMKDRVLPELRIATPARVADVPKPEITRQTSVHRTLKKSHLEIVATPWFYSYSVAVRAQIERVLVRLKLHTG